ncbi:surface antigen protein, partial [Stutzerimonas degradans]
MRKITPFIGGRLQRSGMAGKDRGAIHSEVASMKYSSILLLSASLLSSAAFAGSNTEAAVGGALGGALGSVVGEHLGGSTGAAIGAGVGGAAGGAVGADRRNRTE